MHSREFFVLKWRQNLLAQELEVYLLCNIIFYRIFQRQNELFGWNGSSFKYSRDFIFFKYKVQSNCFQNCQNIQVTYYLLISKQDISSFKSCQIIKITSFHANYPRSYLTFDVIICLYCAFIAIIHFYLCFIGNVNLWW